MAQYALGENYDKATIDHAEPTGTNILDVGIFTGKVRTMQDQYTFGASSLNSTDYIIVGGKLPTGSQVVNITLCMGSPLASNASIVVGDEGDPNRYIESTYLFTAGTVGIGPTVSTGMQYVVTGTTDNYIRIAGASIASIVSGANVKVTIEYVMS